MQGLALESERGHDVNLEAVRREPFGVAGALTPEGEVESDHPATQLHHRLEPVDELPWRQGRQRAVERQHYRVLNSRGFEQRELLLQGRDRLGTVRGIEHAPRVRLERDQGGLSFHLPGCSDDATNHVCVTEVDAVEAPHRDRHGTNRARRQPSMNLQVRTFSGTKVRRRGSV